MANQSNHADALAEIGAREKTSKDTLQKLVPIERSQMALGTWQHQADAAFTPREPVETLEALSPWLDALRQRYAEFEQVMAPDCEPSWHQTKLVDFDWRVATEQDWLDFSQVPAGGGDWKRVQIPHYGEPVGPATTFYRRTFTVAKGDLPDRAMFLRFRGVDYKAHVFVNGALAGSHEGFFAAFEFNISRMVRPGENTLVVRVDNDFSCLGEPQHDDLPKYDGDKIMAATNQGYDEPVNGWHHCPPAMGIYQDVWLESRPQVHLRDVFVRPLKSLEEVEVWIEVINTRAEPVPVAFELSIYGQNFDAVVFEKKPLEENLEAGLGVSFYKFSVPLASARQWTPESPWLYQAQVHLLDPAGNTVDRRAQQFGMRWFEMDEATSPKGMFYLNGKKIRLRGANTMGHEQQCVMRGDFDQLREDLLLAKAANMNFLRLTQRPVQTEIYEACDRLGLLTQTDLPLFAHLRRNQFSEAVRQSVEMERHVRAHPCNVLISYINEPFPDAWRNMKHRRLARPDLERFFWAASEAVLVENPDRVIKPVDGDYDPPTWGLPDNHCYTYWYLGHGIDAGELHKGYWQPIKPGWNYGCGEFGAEGIDRLELLQKYCPQEWLPTGPDDTEWSPRRISRAQAWKMGELFFDVPDTAQGWIDSTREHQRAAMQKMTEAFRRDPRNVSCAIHLFIDAWPTGWMKTIVDVDRVPKPAYFAYRDALTPLMISLRTDRMRYVSGEQLAVELWLCNDTNRTPDKLRIHWQLEDGAGQVLHAEALTAAAQDCTAECLGQIGCTLPSVSDRTNYRVRAALFEEGEFLHETSLQIEVFPESQPTPGFHAMGAQAERIKQEANAPENGTAILCTDFDAFRENEPTLLQEVEAGATLILTSLPLGEHCIAESTVTVKNATMAPHHFVSRKTGHPLVAEFQPHDFDWWYQADLDRVAPLHDSVMVAEAWNTVLRTCDHGWSPSDTPEVAVCLEKDHGAGRLILCQLNLAGFVTMNPPARRFLQVLFGA